MRDFNLPLPLILKLSIPGTGAETPNFGPQPLQLPIHWREFVGFVPPTRREEDCGHVVIMTLNVYGPCRSKSDQLQMYILQTAFQELNNISPKVVTKMSTNAIYQEIFAEFLAGA
jgi:hypothetical protein